MNDECMLHLWLWLCDLYMRIPIPPSLSFLYGYDGLWPPWANLYLADADTDTDITHITQDEEFEEMDNAANDLLEVVE